jgi:hypothetical protein
MKRMNQHTIAQRNALESLVTPRNRTGRNTVHPNTPSEKKVSENETEKMVQKSFGKAA